MPFQRSRLRNSAEQCCVTLLCTYFNTRVYPLTAKFYRVWLYTPIIPALLEVGLEFETNLDVAHVPRPFFQKSKLRAREMARRRLKALAFLPEELSLTPSTRPRQLTTTCKFIFRELWTPEQLSSCTHTSPHIHIIQN